MNTNFTSAGNAAKQINTKGNTLWSSLALYARDIELAHLAQEKPYSVEILKEDFKVQELQFNTDNKVKLNTIGAYRSNKSTIVNAVELGVSLFDSKGKVRGKTEVSKDIADAKEASPTKSPIELFQIAMNNATNATSKMTTSTDLQAVYTALKALEKVCAYQLQPLLAKAA